MSGADVCSVRSRAREDSLIGTALPTRRFLLIEDPGPWGSEAHPTGTLPTAVIAQVHAVAQEMSARVLLIRRSGRRPSADIRQWAVADVGSGGIRWGAAATVDALADVDFLGGGTIDSAPAFLVCAQGRHDVCCATEGRPVAAAFAARVPESTWECSHIGGDRFAANLLVLPSGLVYGRVEIADVDRLITADADAMVIPELLRGRSGLAPAAQVVESHVRQLWDESRDRVVTVDSVEHLGEGRWRVRGGHTADSRQFDIEVIESHSEVESGLTCAAIGPGLLRSWTIT